MTGQIRLDHKSSEKLKIRLKETRVGAGHHFDLFVGFTPNAALKTDIDLLVALQMVSVETINQ